MLASTRAEPIILRLAWVRTTPGVGSRRCRPTVPRVRLIIFRDDLLVVIERVSSLVLNISPTQIDKLHHNLVPSTVFGLIRTTFSAASTAMRRGSGTHRIDRADMFRCVRGPPHNAMEKVAGLRSPARGLKAGTPGQRYTQSNDRRRAICFGASAPPRARAAPPSKSLTPLQPVPCSLAF